MAVIVLKPEEISGAAVEVLERLIVIPGTIDTYPGTSFIGVKNDTVTRRIPARGKALRKALRATGADRVIQTQDLTESSISIKLTDHNYFATDVTDENFTLDITSFTEQILVPSVRAVVEELEIQAYELIADARYVANLNTHVWDPSATDTRSGNKTGAWHMATSVGKKLTKAFVPAGGRIMLVGSEIAFLVKNDAKLEPGPNVDTISSLSEATLGKLAGFTFVESPLLEDDEAYAYTRSAFTQAVLAPAVPESLKFGKTAGSNGFGLRWIRDYDSTVLSDRSIVDVYSGGASVEDGIIPTGFAGAGERYNARAARVTLA